MGVWPSSFQIRPVPGPGLPSAALCSPSPPLCPCSELAFQLADQFRALGAGMSLKDCVVVGGLDMTQQAKQLSRRPHVVIATPGRLRALLGMDAELARAFGRAKFLVSGLMVGIVG